MKDREYKKVLVVVLSNNYGDKIPQRDVIDFYDIGSFQNFIRFCEGKTTYDIDSLKSSLNDLIIKLNGDKTGQDYGM